jgi:archaellum component FlaF (FlaF/FlaG flagellin family)
MTSGDLGFTIIIVAALVCWTIRYVARLHYQARRITRAAELTVEREASRRAAGGSADG